MAKRLSEGRLGLSSDRRWQGLLVGVTILVGLAGRCEAVSQAAIQRITGKSLLTDVDKQLVADYVAEQLTSLTQATGVPGLSEPTMNLLTYRKGQAKQSEREYSDTFARAVKEQYQRVWAEAAEWQAKPNDSDKQLGNQMKLNVALLLGQTDNPILLEDLLARLTDEAQEIRYWGARGLGMPNLQQHLLAATEEQVNAVTAALEATLAKSDAFLTAAIAQAAGLPQNGSAMTLLQSCAERRVTQYRSWKVTSEAQDLIVIDRLLNTAQANELRNDIEQQRSLVLRAAELYTAAYYRYSQGISYKDSGGKELPLLSDQSQWELTGLLIDGELSFLAACNSGRQGSMFHGAIQKGRRADIGAALSRAYAELLGVDGQVNRTFAIYGPDAPEQPDSPPA